MGDRVLFQVVGKPASGGNVGPAIYGHWAGSEAPDIARRVVARMAARGVDIPYWTARVVQELIGDADGCTGYGVWNATKTLTAKDSHGDAGVILIHLSDPTPEHPQCWRFECLGGYLTVGADGFPTEKSDD